ncbi:MAG: cytochrome c oxidase assembly protein [Methylococcales bacterium]|nr:cytochrome c oxidase assembly protein [Methylococcales bacterium]
MSTDVEIKNRRLLTRMSIFAVLMFGFGFALVPLYDVFCDITGLNGKTGDQAIAETVYNIDTERTLTMEFVTSVGDAPIEFRAETAKLSIHPGQYYTVNFYARNLTDRPMVARAIPSVTPGLAAEFLQKTECFCFNEQHFAPGEALSMPMRFVIKPDLPEKFKTVTLAYTFFDNTDSNSN